MPTTTIDAAQARKYLANDLAQAALNWMWDSAHKLPFDEHDRMDLAQALLPILERKKV